MTTIIYGTELAKERKAMVKEKVEALVSQGKRLPTLCVIMVGNNPASLSYIKGKEKACEEVGFGSVMVHLPENATQQEVEEEVIKANRDATIDGILVQLPLPKHLNEEAILLQISPDKDVDGLHPVNVGRLHLGKDSLAPCTPLGVMAILQKMDVDLKGKRAVVLGRSKLVGEPVAKLLLDANATVTVCHSKTEDLAQVCKEADVLIAAIGKPLFVTEAFIKEGAYVVDVGINRVEGHLVGDVDFEAVKDHTTAITPVPKGVGPMTICMLLENTLKAYQRRSS